MNRTIGINRTIEWIVLGATFVLFPHGGVRAQPVGEEAGFEPSVVARIWLDRGDEPVLDRGDRVRVYYRTSQDGYLAIFHIDTNGTVRLLFPASPETDHFVRGGVDYRLLFPRASTWFVDEDPGQGYFFALASPQPFDFRDFRFSRAAGGWDLSFVGRTAYEDPFVAMDDYIARLVPDWEYADYSLDYASYDVGGAHDYPRFMCYECHGFTPYSAWNPYLSACTSFRVVIYNDPWYYPVNRYVGTRVVYVRPSVWRQPRYVFKERARGEPWTPLVQPRPTVQDQPGIRGTPAQRRTGGGIGTGGTIPPVSGPTMRPGTLRPEPRTRPGAGPGGGSGTASSPVPTVRGMPTTRPTESTRYVPNTRGADPLTRGATPSTRAGSPSGGTPSTRTPSTRTTPTGRETPDTRTTNGSPATRTTPSDRLAPSTRTAPSTRVSPPIRTTPTSRPTLERRPPAGGSGGAAVRPPARATSGSTSRAPVRSSGSATRAPVRSSSGSTVRIPTRSSSGSTSRAPVRSSGGSTARAPTRAPTRAPVRSSAGSSSRAPTRSAPPKRPVVRRKPGGGD